MKFQGVLSRTVTLSDNDIKIEVKGSVEKILGIPSVTIPLANIESVELKKGDFFKKASFQFLIAGAGYIRGSEKGFKPNENPYLIFIPFGKYSEAEKFVTEVLRKMKETKVVKGQLSSDKNAIDPLEGLKKLSHLKDAGIISEAEFQAKKIELLSRI